MGLEHVDLYYLHLEDTTTPLDATIAAVGQVIHAGKARDFTIATVRTE